jgi:hypothetical protein
MEMKVDSYKKFDEIEGQLQMMRDSGISVDAWEADNVVCFEIDGAVYVLDNTEENRDYIKSMQFIDDYGKKN